MARGTIVVGPPPSVWERWLREVSKEIRPPVSKIGRPPSLAAEAA